MSSLTTVEKIKLESLFEMSSGYVLRFSNKTFTAFFWEDFFIDIDHEKYQTRGTSKANRLRSFWNQEEDKLVGKVLEQLLLISVDKKPNLYIECRIIINRLLKFETIDERNDIDRGSAVPDKPSEPLEMLTFSEASSRELLSGVGLNIGPPDSAGLTDKGLNSSSTSYIVNNFGQIGIIGNDGKDNFFQNNKNVSFWNRIVRICKIIKGFFNFG